ncbi:MAG: hypothetical protein V3S18_08715 [Dehalococcoidia bacterium]
MTARRRPLWILVLTAATLLLIGACGGSKSEPEPTPTPEPSPTPVPETTFRLITADPETDRAAFEAAIPDAERECLQDRLGEAAYQALFTDEAFSADTPAEVLACLSNKTLGGIIIGQSLAGSAPGAGLAVSDETLACMGDRVKAVDFAGILTAISDDEPGLEAGLGGFMEFAQVLFCLNDAERAAVEGAMFGGDDGDDGDDGEPIITLDTVECLFNAAGPDGLTALFGIAGSTDSRDPAGGFFGTGASPELIRAFMECGGAELLRGAGGFGGFGGSGFRGGELDRTPEDLGITAEQVACLEEAGLDGALDRLLLGGGARFMGLIEALEQCGIELDPAEQLPEGGAFGSSFSLFPEQIACLEALGLEDLAPRALFGALGGSPEITAALEQCGIELPSFGGGFRFTPGSIDPDLQPGAEPPLIEPTPGLQSGGEPLPIELEEVGLTPDQIECLAGELGDEAVAGLVSGEAGLQLGLQMLSAASRCDVDLAELLN